MPAMRWSLTWQWNIQVPTASGTMSAVTCIDEQMEDDLD
jgi:hypothetical protein